MILSNDPSEGTPGALRLADGSAIKLTKPNGKETSLPINLVVDQGQVGTLNANQELSCGCMENVVSEYSRAVGLKTSLVLQYQPKPDKVRVCEIRNSRQCLSPTFNHYIQVGNGNTRILKPQILS